MHESHSPSLSLAWLRGTLLFAGALMMLMTVLLSGCMQGIADPGSTYRKGLQREAWRTQEAYDQALLHRERSRLEIPPQYWAAEIARLQPVKVYIHRVNLVVVLAVQDGVEHGLYIYLPTSRLHPRESWVPRSGVDGFVFRSQWRRDVFHFSREVGWHRGME